MAIRRSRKPSFKKLKNRRKLLSPVERHLSRDMQLERLEERQLLTGAQLIGIQPNDGALIQDSDILNVAPTDLTFHFDQSQVIDEATLGDSDTVGGIQITRANLDGAFAPASVKSDFDTGTSGSPVEIQFSAVRLGADQNGIKLTISKSDFGGSQLPGISVIDRTINLNLNTNQSSPTTALDLISALNNSVDASNLITAEILSGDGSTDIATPAQANTSMELGDPNDPNAVVANDIVVKPGFIGVGEYPATNEVVFRFAEPLPDDRYRIDVFGTGATPLKNTNNELYLDGQDSNLAFELDLAPQIISVVPQPITRKADGSLQQDGDKILVYFNDDDLDPTAAVDPQYYQLIHTAETLENTDDIVFNPISIDYDPAKDLAILTFANNLADLGAGSGTFRLRIGTNETPTPPAPILITPQSTAVATFGTGGTAVQVRYTGNGEQWGEAIQVEVLERDLGQDSLPEVTVRDNVITVVLNTNADPGNVNSPSTAQNLIDAINQHYKAGELITAALESGNPLNVIAGQPRANIVRLDGLGSSFDTSYDAGLLSAQNEIFRSAIEPQVYRLQLPGSNEDPGHRHVVDQHLPDDSANRNISVVGDGAVDMEITRFEYNFRQDIGFLTDAQGNQQSAFNVITEAQKERAREVFQVLSDVIGVEFVETESDGLIIASGDTSAFNFNQPLRVFSVDLDDRFNGSWFRTAQASITAYLGLGNTWDLPGQAARSADTDLNFDNRIEPTILSNNDVEHLRQLYYPESKDIDLYRFEVNVTGRFTAETFAERMLESSLLDTTLRLYREAPNGSRQLLAQNDDYYGRDSFVALDLEPGVYYVGVSAAGNLDYDPTIEDTGFGGTSEGEYDLRFNFRPDSFSTIYDADNPGNPQTYLDGDGDGNPGGVHDFWFRAQTPSSVIFVDKMGVDDGGSVQGEIGNPYQTVSAALAAADPGDIVRIVGNPGEDGDWTTLDDNQAYQVGFSSLGTALPDGSTMEVPQGVTVMIDQGAVFQMRRARIGVGSSAAGIDRSAGALQVLGAPYLLADANSDGSVDINDTVRLTAEGDIAPGSTYFTSYQDESIGLDTNPFITTPVAGDWGGLVFRNDIDRADGNFLYGEEGIFLNYVNHADMRYGGGNVLVNSVPTVVNPIHITDTRPTLTHNRITLSADAAISASPDSFEETNFHAPRHQRIAFTSDYERVGPDIHGNLLVENSTNGLFVRVTTQAGSQAQKLNVSGRMDDRDIVHVMSENLAVSGQPGGRMELVTPPPINLVTQNAISDGTPGGGSLGSTTQDTVYSYKLTYIDRFGYESPVSAAMPDLTISAFQANAGIRSVGFAQLPSAPTGYIARRLYRSENSGPYELVAQINRLVTTFIDDGTTRGGILHVPPVVNTTLTPVEMTGATMLAGSYNYVVSYIDSIGKESYISDATDTVTIPTATLPNANAIQLDNLPVPDASENYVTKRIYRSQTDGQGPYQLVAELDASVVSYTDTSFASNPSVTPDYGLEVPRLNARLSIDPSMVVKLDGARIEVEMGAQMIAEGTDGREVIFTSIADDRYGVGGTFDTGNDGAPETGTSNEPEAGKWGGIFAGPLADLSLDHALVAYGGGVTRVEGSFTAFNAVEIHEQSQARVANSVFEFNAGGQGGQGETDRFGRGFNEPGVIFVRQAQPVIYNNIFRNNPNSDTTDNPSNPNLAVPAISINVNALNYELNRDSGRRTGNVDRLDGYRDNQGPLVVANQLDNNELNGMVVRGQTLTTESVWDDTDIVHILLDTIYVSDFHTFGGLVLASSPTQSLVVKLQDNPNGLTQAGFVANGIPHEIDDRIGGIIQIIGQPGSPVVLTSLADDTRGAGERPDGAPQTDTNGDGTGTAPAPGDWNSVAFDEYAHDRNVELYYEQEARDVISPGPNGSPNGAQLLGSIAPNEYGGDENRRLGFTVKGFLTDAKDMDVYSFKGIPGTEVWIDIDRTTQALDAVVELLDGNGTTVATSDNSPAELANPNNFLEPADRTNVNLTSRELADKDLLQGEARLMEKTPQLPEQDLYTINPKDPGMRLLLPGIPDPNDPDRPLTYHVRVRSSSPNLGVLDAGLTSGAYQLQIRLRQDQEIGGSTVRYATIAYATNGIEIYGQPTHSPLTGEYQEPPYLINSNTLVFNETTETAERVGNLLTSDRSTISIAGILKDVEDGSITTPDIDLYRMDLEYDDFYGFTYDDVNGSDDVTFESFETVFDLDYADGLSQRPNAALYVYQLVDDKNNTDPADDVFRLVYGGRNGNVADDRPKEPLKSNIEDLSRGSIGATDPYIGVVDLAADTSYIVAVVADDQMPQQLDQFITANATNANVRLEPIASIRRIAEDHIDFANNSTADDPQISNLIDWNGVAKDPGAASMFEVDSAVPWHLGDVTLYVSMDNGVNTDPTETTLYAVDPFTGQQEYTVGRFGRETGDIAMHPNGNLYTYTFSRNEPNACYPRDTASGNFLEIDPGNASTNQINDDGIVTYVMDPANPQASVRANTCQNAQWGDGIEFNAITFYGNNNGFAVGERGFANLSPTQQQSLLRGVDYVENILYHFVGNPQDADFGEAYSAPQLDRVNNANLPEFLWEGAGTQIRERGELLTSPRMDIPNATAAGSTINLLTSSATVADGDTFTVADGGTQVTFEFDTGPEVDQQIAPTADQSIRDGNFFVLDDKNLFQLDTGTVIQLTGLPSDHAVLTVTAVNNNNQLETNSYEFDRLPNAQGETQVMPGATVIGFTGGTAQGLAGRLATAINADFNLTIATALGSRVSIVNDQAVSVSAGAQNVVLRGDAGAAPILQAVDGSQISEDHEFDIESEPSTGLYTQRFQFDAGYTLNIPVRYQLQLPAVGGRGISDGETFTISNSATGSTVTFEFDRDGTVDTSNPDYPNNVITFNAVDTPDQLAAKIVAVVSNGALNLDLAATNQGNGLVHFGTTDVHTVTNGSSATLIGGNEWINDGETFEIRVDTDNDGTPDQTFVFEMDSNNDGFTAAHGISFTPAWTEDEIADEIASVIAGAGIPDPSGRLAPQNIGEGRVHLGGDDGNPSGSPRHILVTDALPGTNNIHQEVGGPGVDAGSIAIPYVPSSQFTAEDVVNAIQAAINNAVNDVQVIQARAGDLYTDGETQLTSIAGTPVTLVFYDETIPTNPPAVGSNEVAVAFNPGALAATPPVQPTSANVMATRIESALNALKTSITGGSSVSITAAGNNVTIKTFPLELTTQNVDDRLVVNGNNVAFSQVSSNITDLVAEWSVATDKSFTLIDNVEEVDPRVSPQVGVPTSVPGRNLSDHYIASRVSAVVSAHPDYFPLGAGGAFSRINFPGADSGDFRGVDVWNVVATSTQGVSAGNERIPLLAQDEALDYFIDANSDGVADDVNGDGVSGQNSLTPQGDRVPGLANKIADAITVAFATASNDPDPVQATYNSSFVRVSKGEVLIPVGVNISVAGAGPGGAITGITQVGTEMYAVSDNGGLFRVNGFFGSNASTTYIDSSADDLVGIEFSGLTTGPANVEGGKYADMLFAIDTSGDLYAFGTDGILQPIFPDGQKSVSTGVYPFEVRGLAFSTLDENLWGVTPYEDGGAAGIRQSPTEMDYRLGLFTNPPVNNSDDIRVYYRQKDDGHERYNTTPGTQSMHFGQGYAYDLNGAGLGPRSYDFPGGAHGSIVSNEFSLKGYQSADRPALYFSYWLDTQQESTAPGTGPMMDAFRVFVSDNNGDWQLLTTNDSYNGGDKTITPFEVQETFDEGAADGDWRQVRVSLDQYAGRDNLRLRFDFDTGADTNIGDINTTGFELRTVSGVFIQDGDLMQIDGQQIEWESGLTVVAPTGAAIAPGEQMTVEDESGNQAVFRFVNDVLTAADIVAVDGSQLNDGDAFLIDDGTTTQRFEFDTNLLVAVPADGGATVDNAFTFEVDLGDGNPPIRFEFDKDDTLDGLPAKLIDIRDNLTLVIPEVGIDGVAEGHYFSVQQGTTTIPFEFDTNGSAAGVPINIRPNFTLQMPAVGGGFGGVADGDWFEIDTDGPGGAPAVVFEFDDNGTTSFGNEPIPFDHFTTQDVLAERVVDAVNNRVGDLNLTAKNLGGGLVVLDGTTPLHTLDTTAAPTLTPGSVDPTRAEIVERVIATMDAVDGVDGTILGLTLPNPADVVDGRIVLGGTTGAHELLADDISVATPGPKRDTTPRSADEIADRMATEINAAITNPDFQAAALAGGMVTLIDLTGGTGHTLTSADATPWLTQLGSPGVTAGSLPVYFAPTDNLDEIINGNVPVVSGGPVRPGMVFAIDNAGLNVDAEQAIFPNEEVILLTGTAGNTVTFSPLITNLGTRGVIPIYVDSSQTPNDVAERVALAIDQAVAQGVLSNVTPHLNGDLGYDPPSVQPGEVRLNRVNLEGVVQITMSSGVTSPVVIEGTYGRNTPNSNTQLAYFNSDMHRDDVAVALQTALETLFYDPTIITSTGDNYADGDTFILEDGTNRPVVFEFDSGLVLQVPGGGGLNQGGITDGETFTLSSSSTVARQTFEFDKDGNVVPGNVAIQIREGESPLGVASQIVTAVAADPISASLNLDPRVLSGNRVQLGGASVAQLEISPGSALTQAAGDVGVGPAAALEIQQTLEMQLPDPLTLHIPGGDYAGQMFRDGETLTLRDPATFPVQTVTLEFDDIGSGTTVQAGNIPVRFDASSTDEDIAREIRDAINQAGLNVEPTILGGTGNIDLGGGSQFALTLPGGTPLIQTGPLSFQPPAIGGGGITDGDWFSVFDADTATTYDFEFTNGAGSIGGATKIPFGPSYDQDAMADLIVTAVQGVVGLDLLPTKTAGAARIHLGAGTTLTANTDGTHLTQTGQTGQLDDGQQFVITSGTSGQQRFELNFDTTNVWQPIDISPSSTPRQIAAELVQEIGSAFPELSPEYLGDGRIHVGGDATTQLDTSSLPGVSSRGVGGIIEDGTTFILSLGSQYYRFEYDSDGSAVYNNSTLISYTDADSTDAIAAATVSAIAGRNIGLAPIYEGDGIVNLNPSFQVLDVTVTSSLTSAGGFLVQVPEAGGAIPGVADGEIFTITDTSIATDYVFEFESTDINDGVQTGNIAIPFDVTSTQNDIAHAIVSAVGAEPGLSLTPNYLGDGLVNLAGIPSVHTLDLHPSDLSISGEFGAQPRYVAVNFSPTSDFDASEVAQAMVTAIDGVTFNLLIDASAGIQGTANQRRVTLTHDTGIPEDIQITLNAAGLQRETPTDIFKRDKDLVRVIGHNVTDAGPIGNVVFDNDSFTVMPGDALGDFNNNERGQNNVYEGVYLDDFFLGFSERGEQVLNAGNDPTSSRAFIDNPDGAGSVLGEYQLEIRRGPVTSSPLETRFGDRSMDTNDRQGTGLTMVVPRGLDIADGQTFTISDGVNHVVFEYVDTTIPNNLPEPGRINVPFSPSDPDYVVAQTVRDAINGSDAQAVLDIDASISDGTILGAGSPVASTSGRVNLAGTATLRVHATDVEEVNDTLAQATETGIVGVDSPSYLGAGEIGDNPNFPLNTGYDVDLFKVELAAGEQLRIDVDAHEIGSDLDPQLRVFNAFGQQLAINDDSPAPGELPRLDPYLNFTAFTSGTYYVGVSSSNNSTYSPFSEGSGRIGSTGFYQIEMTFGASTGTDFVLYGQAGDHNTFRDQGQIIIQGNTITNSDGYGILSAAAPRAGLDGDIPHMGPVRYTPKLNDDNLTPGVVVTNNVLAYNRTGGIRLAGDLNPLDQSIAAVPFGRIVNNTIYGQLDTQTGTGQGRGIVVENNASPTILNNIIAGLDQGITIDGTSRTTVVGGNIYQDNTANRVGFTLANEDFPIELASGEPLFRNAANGNFYLESQSRAIDSSIGSLLDRFDLQQVKNLIGISDSPILAPATDVTGQLRVDDPQVETPDGFGDNVFIDRGAIDRSDFVGPTADTVTPRDNDADGLDLDPALTSLVLDSTNVLSAFQFRLSDGVPPADPNLGSGIDDSTVTTDNVVVSRDGITLVDGIDYSFSYNATSDTVIITPLSGIWEPDHTYVMRMNNADHFRIDAKTGLELPDGVSFSITDNDGQEATFEFESGYTLGIPETLAITIPAEGGSLGGVSEGASFTVRRSVPGMTDETAVFEFDSNGQVTDNNLDGIPDNYVIPFNVASTPEEIADAMVQQLQLADIGLSPRHIGEGHVHLGSTQEHSVDITQAPSLLLVGQPSGVEDGDAFTIDDGTQVLTFEFDNDSERQDSDADGNPDYPNSILISFSASQTHVEIAQTVKEAIRIADVGLTPEVIGDGRVHLGGVPFVHVVDVSDSNLLLEGLPGVHSAFGLKIPTQAGQPRVQDDGSGYPFISDGDTFTIDDGTRSITFELDDLDDPDFGGRTTAPNVQVAYNSQTSTFDDIANVIVAAIQNAPLQGLNPVNAGNGVVLLGEPISNSPQHTLSVVQSGLAQLGEAGVPASVPVYIRPLPAFDGGQVAVALREAINGSSLGVQAIPEGGDVIRIDNASIVGEINPVFDANSWLPSIKDRAGNSLKPNLLSGETQTTIVLGNALMDFGDAPQTTDGDYPSEIGSNGAIHMIASGGPRLGTLIDAEGNALVSNYANGDDSDNLADEDGVVSGDFNPQTVTQMTVSASDYGLLDAWIDFNIDGDWNDPGEQIFSSQQLVPGANVFEVTPAAATVFGDTIGRFRISTLGGLRPTGLAEDGEVEDHLLTIRPGNPPITVDDIYTFSEDGIQTSPIEVLDNDSDPDNDPLVVSSSQTVSELGAAIAMQSDGIFTYDPTGSSVLQSLQSGQTMVDTFTYRAFDGLFLSDAATVTITVTGENDAPVAVDDTQVVTDQNTPRNVDVLANDFDPEKQKLTITSATGTGNRVSVDPVNDRVVYDPSGDFDYLDDGESATDTFTYEISDGQGGTATANVTVTITGLNDSPIAATDFYDPGTPADDRALANEDNAKVVDVLANDSDPEGKDIQVTQVNSVVTKGLVTINNLGTPYNDITYDPDGQFETLAVGQTATDTFTYIVRDADGNNSLGSVTMTVEGRNDAPIATDDRGSLVARNSTVTIDVLINDYDIDVGDVLSVDIFIPDPPAGNATVVNNQIVYDPNGQFDYLSIGQTETDTFTYTVEDNNGAQSQKATVTVTVQGASDPPTAVDDPVTTDEDTSINIFVLGNDTDDFGPMSVESVDDTGLRGSVTLNQSTNSILYSPDSQFDTLKPGETDVETFTYSVTDGTGSDTGTVIVTINGVNDAPVANVDANAYEVQRGGQLTADDVNRTTATGADDSVLVNDFDAEGDSLAGGTLTARVVELPQNGSLQFNDDGTFVYTHNGGGSTFDTFSYQAVDSSGTGSLQVVPVVISVVDAPAAEWQNPSNSYDVNNSGAVSPIDVLLVINLINDPNFGIGYQFPAPRPAGSYFYDTDGSGVLSPSDALGIINFVNSQNAAQNGGNPEGESAPAAEGEAPLGLPSSVEQVAAAPVSNVAPATVAAEGESEDLSPWQTAPKAERAVNIDLWGVEDAVNAIAGEVDSAIGQRSPLDDLLDEMFA